MICGAVLTKPHNSHEIQQLTEPIVATASPCSEGMCHLLSPRVHRLVDHDA
jgi:hypothetical protein